MIGRVLESQKKGVESQPSQRIQGTAVSLISHDGVTLLREVSAYLVFPAGLQSYFQRRQVRKSAQHPKMSDRVFACRRVYGGMHAARPIFGQMAANGVPVLSDYPFDYGPVLTLNFVFSKEGLKPDLDCLRFSEDQQATGEFVETVDDKKPALCSALLQALLKIRVYGVFLLVQSGHSQEAWRLFNPHEVTVFVSDCDAAHPGGQPRVVA